MIKKIYVERSAREERITKEILKNLPGAKIHYGEECGDKIRETLRLSKDPIGEGKEVLLLTNQKGSFLKRCPGTKRYICCGYYFLNLATNCDLDCTYCILQSYLLNNPFLKIFVNTSTLLEELERIFKNSDSFYRIGTGELTDSLSLDHLTHFSRILVPFFSKQKNAVLELKTKTNNIGNLLDLEPSKRVVVSWSLNTEKIIQEEENGTSSLDERLLAAKACAERGYLIGFHFDPLFYYSGWREDYEEVIRRLFNTIDPESIVWISLGAFRFIPNLKFIIQNRFQRNRLIYGEFIRGLDNKMRYFKPIRIEMYHNLFTRIREYARREVFVYLCMESQEVWQRSFGSAPKNTMQLSSMLDERVRKKLHRT